MPVVPQGIPGKMKTHPVSSQCVGYSRPACTFFFSFLPFLWPFLTLFYDTGFPAASAWWPQLLEPKWHQVFARDDDGLVVVPADFQNTVHLIKVLSPARVESPRWKEMYLQHGESRISCPVDDFLKCSFLSVMPAGTKRSAASAASMPSPTCLSSATSSCSWLCSACYL